MSDSSRDIPVYKPTPIVLLDDAKQRSRSASPSQNVSPLEYRPTPIHELDMYAPMHSSIYSPHISSATYCSDLPTYSPVVQRPSSNLPGSEFCLPSPAYPPITNENKNKSSIYSFVEPTSFKRKKPSPILVDHDDVEKNEDKIKSQDKRKKILNLYLDLYADDDKDKGDEKKKTKMIAPVPRNESSKMRLSLPSISVPCSSSIQSMPVSTLEASIEKVVSPKDLPTTRPTNPLRRSTKIPMPIRTRYLDQFIEACLRVSPSPPQAYALALKEEQKCHDKAANRLVYLNMVIASLNMLKTQLAYVPSPSTSSTSSSLIPSSKMMGKPEARPEVDFDEMAKGQKLYEELQPFLISEKTLAQNGYPVLDTSEKAPRGRVRIKIPHDKQTAMSRCGPNQRFCCRCGTLYLVNNFGEAVNKQECTYHWGKLIQRRVPGFGIDFRYTCCQVESGQLGCALSYGGHVYDINKWRDLDGYLSTLPALPQSDPNAPIKVYAVDCEMVYTTGGCELARVTVIDSRLDVVLDKIVRPENPIVDPNTRFSGLLREEIEASETRITDIQMELLHLWDEDTILIGHSLESDLIALKFVHMKIVDTSLVFPHTRGLPYKRALRTLAADFLQQVIQQNESGHDSKEDAIACMRLMQLKVKESLQKKLRKSSLPRALP